MISWNGAAEKYDIRDWAPEHEKWEKELLYLKKRQKLCMSYWVKL
mgnify:CR=1 FL=1